MTLRSRLVTLFCMTLAAASLAAPALAATRTVELTPDNRFVPGSSSVSVGDTVQFDWTGGFHDVSFSDGTSSGAPTADTGVLYLRTFDSPGTYSYVCTVHESVGMTGTITVAAASGDNGADASSPTGGTDAGAGSDGSREMPFTGPEPLLPAAGGVLVLLGAVGLGLVRRARA